MLHADTCPHHPDISSFDNVNQEWTLQTTHEHVKNHFHVSRAYLHPFFSVSKAATHSSSHGGLGEIERTY